VIAIAIALCAGSATAQEKQVIRMPGSLEGLPFSSAVRVGDLLFLSGQIGNRPGTRELVPGGIGAQTRQTMENIRAVLEYAGSSLDRVVKCTVFLADFRDYVAMNDVYASFFPQGPPARSALGSNGLALGAAVEIECIALAGDRS
jgi:reactive intermediate/imine deaminase